MKINLLFIVLISIIIPFNTRSQVNWKSENVILKGKVLNFEKHKEHRTIEFSFDNLISNKIQNIFVTEIDSFGNFDLEVPILYTQDFCFVFGRYIHLLCSPGDSLFLEIDADIFNNVNNSRPNGQYFVRIVDGNRIKDNTDLLLMQSKLNEYFNLQSYWQAAKIRSASEFKSYVRDRDYEIRGLLNEFKIHHHTGELFNIWVNDYLKYQTLYVLIGYPSSHSMRNNINEDSIKLPPDYYDFLLNNDLNDNQVISSIHGKFLRDYTEYVQRIPRDSLQKANSHFIKHDIIHGAQALKRMIYQNTSGFTQDLALTHFYLRAIGGQQLEEFEALYDSNSITDPYLRGVIKYEYKNLQKYLNNQLTNGANLRSINSSIAKNLIDTILAKYSGKVIYIDFWAPWCVPCMYEMPYSKELQNFYKNKEVVFLFLANRCNDSWKTTIANQKLTGEHILLKDDQFNILSGEFGIKGIPHYVLIDKKGNIVLKNAARPSQMDLLKKQIDKLL